MNTALKCRHCDAPITQPFLDLGHAPPSNAYLSETDLSRPEITFPLRVHACLACGLVQTEDYTEADSLFTKDYAYLSSTSASWLKHAKDYSYNVIERFNLTPDSFVMELASNDGYLLKNFLHEGIPCLGVEPTTLAADISRSLGIPTLEVFFGLETAQTIKTEYGAADLICGNNVFAHVPDINDFSAGIAHALKPQGVVSLEFPHLLNLIELCQFDTVYHEHFSYLSLRAVKNIFQSVGMRIFNVEKLPTHGGSLRVFGCLRDALHREEESVERILTEEKKFGLNDFQPYSQFQKRSEAIKDDLIEFLIDCKRSGKSVAGYGAAAKGNTLLNFAGIRPDLLPYVCDAAQAKQGKFLPASHIPILKPDEIIKKQPDVILILPWNIASEVKSQLSSQLGANTAFWIAVPKIQKI